MSEKITAAAETQNVQLQNILKEASVDSASNYRLSGEQTEALENYFQQLDILVPQPTAETIRAGVDNARRLVNNGLETEYLANQPFVNLHAFRELTKGVSSIRLILDKQFYVKTDKIVGADGHNSWAGRGYKGSGEVGVAGMRPENAQGYSTTISRNKIADYAFRETPLRKFELFCLDLILTDDGPMLWAENAHRVSAAKLRNNEPIGFDSITIYDARQKT